MTLKEWLLLAAGAVLAEMINLAHPFILGFLGSQNLKRLHRRRTQEWANYKRIKAFREGKSDRYFFYVFWSAIGVCFLIVCTASTTAESLLDLREKVPPASTFFSLIDAFFLISIFTVLSAFLVFATLYLTARNLENFEKYEAKVREKWGLPPEE